MMRLRIAGGAPVGRVEAERGDARAWLEVVVRLSGLPEGDRTQVRDELLDHIEGRVRDLMLTGRGEREAVAEAIGELGDAAELAKNLRAANRPRRSMTMVMGAAVVAAGLAVAAVVWQPGGHAVPVRVFEPSRAAEAGGGSKLSARAGGTWQEFFAAAGEAAKLPVVVNWRAMGELLGEDGELSGRPVGTEFKDLALPTAVAMVNDARGLKGSDRLDWRVVDGSLVFSTTSFFDRQEMVLVTYDLSGVPNIDIGGEAGTMEQIKGTILKLVEPEAWEEGGGTLAKMTEVGTKLFVRAPRRLQAGVEWVLGEVGGDGGAKGAAGKGAASVRVYAMQRVSAEQAAVVLRTLWGEGSELQGVSADARTNAVVLKGPEKVLAEVERVLRGMDAISEKPEELNRGGKGAALPENVRQLLGPGEVIAVSHADAGEIAAVVARRMVEWTRETGAGRWVVEARDGGVLVAGEPGPCERAAAMVRELDAVLGRAGRARLTGGFEPGPGVTPSARAELVGAKIGSAVPVLGDVPIINRLFTNGAPAFVLRAEGGKIRITGDDGTVVEAEEIRLGTGAR